MADIKILFEHNTEWAERMERSHPGFFHRLASQQHPDFLWIGCSDSRVPANEIIGLLPGEVFVHRNVANVVVHTDLNLLSVVQYAVEVLEVEDIIVCGHYGCGGVAGALSGKRLGLIDNWLRSIKDIHHRQQALFAGFDDEKRINMMCELNVIEQVANLCETTVIQEAWQRGQGPKVHGWIYGLEDGRLRDLGVDLSTCATLDEGHRRALEAFCDRNGIDRKLLA